jgi:hypothetical protein
MALPFRRDFKMKKTVFAILAAAIVAAGSIATTPPAQAGGGDVAAGIAGGLIGGALIGGAIANSRPAYAAPAPVYVEEPPCHMVRERFWDGYGWRFRRIRVCD